MKSMAWKLKDNSKDPGREDVGLGMASLRVLSLEVSSQP